MVEPLVALLVLESVVARRIQLQAGSSSLTEDSQIGSLHRAVWRADALAPRLTVPSASPGLWLKSHRVPARCRSPLRATKWSIARSFLKGCSLHWPKCRSRKYLSRVVLRDALWVSSHIRLVKRTGVVVSYNRCGRIAPLAIASSHRAGVFPISLRGVMENTGGSDWLNPSTGSSAMSEESPLPTP